METAASSHQNARQFLREELERRCQRNSKYSLRAFAKSLGVSHTILSMVLSGKRPLASRSRLAIAEKLGLDPIEKQNFLEAGSPAHRALPRAEVTAAQALSLDEFALIADWYHYGILSLLDTPGARWDCRWIASRLGITETQATLAMERLSRLKLVKRVGGRWKQSGAPIRIDNRDSTAATRKFHQQLLAKAAESLEQDPIEERDFRSMTFAVDPALLPYARTRIRDFRRQLVEELEARGNAKRVYTLAVQLFPVQKKENVR
ncbi:MAG: DUF4423 domain-containing protein [Bdellovibrionota bacterium]